MKKSLCIFPHFATEGPIPWYVLCYLRALRPHFDEIILVSNDRQISNEEDLLPLHIELKKVDNRGYDFGKFYQVYTDLSLENYHQIACINDSNIVFGKLHQVFEWAATSNADFWGLLDADIKPKYSTHEQNAHLQSHFLVFNQKAIDLLPAFFNTIQVEEILNSTDTKELKKRVINDWEIGLSQFMLKRGLLVKSFVDSRAFLKQIDKPIDANISLLFYPELIAAGVPMLKKKVITSVKPRDIFKLKNHWTRLIDKYGEPDFDLPRLKTELKQIRWKYLKSKLGI